MVEKSPFFSIIVPVYNPNLKYLDTCINSLIKQSFHDYEIIIIDDGSEKKYTEKMDQYSINNEKITVFHDINKGVSVARNKGIAIAKADWILFVDADDWLEFDALQRLYNYLCGIECDILLFSAVKEFATCSIEMKYGLESKKLYDLSRFKVKERFYKRAMSTPNLESENQCVIYYSWDKVFSKKFLIDNKIEYPVGITNSEDKVFILRCFEKTKALYFVDDKLYHYRINDLSASKKYKENADTQRLSLMKLLNKIAVRMDSELAQLSCNEKYHSIYDEYMRFCFGIISDVFNYKFYNKGYPRDNKTREKEVKAFLNTQPFHKAIRYVRYRDLSLKGKLKKFLLLHNMSQFFYYLKKNRMKKLGEIPNNN